MRMAKQKEERERERTRANSSTRERKRKRMNYVSVWWRFLTGVSLGATEFHADQTIIYKPLVH
jgi:hypothetical protein